MIIILSRRDGTKTVPGSIQFATLAHPKTGHEVVYLITDGELYEFQSCQPRKYGAWFIDERVCSDSMIYLGGFIDPRLLILPYLEKDSSKFCLLDQIVPVSTIPLQHSSLWKLDEICSINDKLGDDMTLYRLDESKTLNWLRNKVNKTSKVIAKQKKLAAQKDCFVDTFNVTFQSSKLMEVTDKVIETDPDQEDTKRALQIITEYLSANMTGKLLQSYGLNTSDIEGHSSSVTKRKADWETALEIEKETAAFSGSGTSASTITAAGMADSNKKPKPASSAKPGSTAGKGKALPPATGTKSIASFFGKK